MEFYGCIEVIIGVYRIFIWFYIFLVCQDFVGF